MAQNGAMATMDSDFVRAAVPWLSLILKGIFENRSAHFVWPYIHPTARKWIISKHLSNTSETVVEELAEIVEPQPNIRHAPSRHPLWPELNETVVRFFHANLDEYDHTTWGIVTPPVLLAPGLEEYLLTELTDDRTVEAGVPILAYRVVMRHDPDVLDNSPACWYFAGFKGEVFE